MTDSDIDKALPNEATVVCHWPGQSTNACPEHAEKLQGIARAMGMPPVEETPVMEDVFCDNCVNSLKGK